MGGSGRWMELLTGQRAARPVASIVAAAALSVLAVPLSPSVVGGLPAGASTTARTVWLCRPGTALDPCTYSRASTSVSASGATSVSSNPAPSSTAKRFDCFYVYPTVSTQKTDNANLAIQPAEIAAAAAQASRFSQVCNVWAPMYRQATNAALANGQATSPTVANVAYASLLSAWRDFLAHDDDGRPIVFIGHSQGAAMLIRLLRSQVDPSPKLSAATRVRHHPRRQRPGSRWPRRGRQLRAHPRLQLAFQDRLRHRLLDLPLDATAATHCSVGQVRE